MIDPYVFDQVSENEDAYEAAKARHKKKLRDLLAVRAMLHAMAGEDALYNDDNYDDFEDEIYND